MLIEYMLEFTVADCFPENPFLFHKVHPLWLRKNDFQPWNLSEPWKYFYALARKNAWLMAVQSASRRILPSIRFQQMRFVLRQ